VLKVYNTLKGSKETFRPLAPGRIRMYVCGVTVYDRSHLGHARSAIVFDVIRRYLKYKGYRVRYVRNFTDVDDKIINRAHQEGKSWKEIAETYIRTYEEDMIRLGVKPADVEPKATEYINRMVGLIRQLVRKEYAYAVDGNVYYRVKRFKGYGKLSKRKAEELLSGARVEVDERKEDPLDFALWKASKPGEPTWDSPWGPGRPGWHIECSAMSMALLGRTFDLHGGGKDLVFPHHENEIAQSEAATGKPFARYWIHNGFVTVDQEKMSKSLGNFFTVQEIFSKSPWPEAITSEIVRYLLLSTHYRSPIDWSDAALKSVKAGLDHFYDLFLRLEEARPTPSGSGKAVKARLSKFEAQFERAMDDDFNTAAAIAEFQKLRADLNRLMEKGISKSDARKIAATFTKIGSVLGLFQLNPKEWIMKEAAPSLSEEEVLRRVSEREEARRQKDWAKADVIRKQLAEAGIILEDRPDGTTRVKR
jgi:cysteinyl-tRNA synthetase